MSFGNLKIPQKLMAVFAVMLATIMAMGVALYVNKVNLGHSVERTERAYEMLRAADTAAFRLTRQENSLRGFLLSADPYYVKRLEEAHKPKFLKALDKLKTLADGNTEDLARIAAVESAYANYRKLAIEPGEQLGADPATRAARCDNGQMRGDNSSCALAAAGEGYGQSFSLAGPGVPLSRIQRSSSVVKCAGGTMAMFYPNGRIESCTLDNYGAQGIALTDYAGKPTTCASRAVARFDPEGRVLSCGLF